MFIVYVGKAGVRYNLPDKLITSDDEGNIYSIMGQPNLLAKIYKPDKITPEEEQRLMEMISSSPNAHFQHAHVQSQAQSQTMHTHDILYDNGKFVGVVMIKSETRERSDESDTDTKYPDKVESAQPINPVPVNSSEIPNEEPQQDKLLPIHFLPLPIPVAAIVVWIVWGLDWVAVLMNLFALVLAIIIVPKKRVAFRIMMIMHTSFWAFITFAAMLL